MRLFQIFTFLFLTSNICLAQNIWTDAPDVLSDIQDARIQLPNDYRTLNLDFEAMKSVLENAPMEFTEAAKNQPLVIALPMPDGRMENFEVAASPMMEQGLADKFPEIKTYIVQGVDDPTASGRLDINAKYFNAFIISSKNSLLINPANEVYLSFYKKNQITPKTTSHECGFDHQQSNDNNAFTRTTFSIGEDLRTYRFAVNATGEYSSYHTNTQDVGEVIAAITTAVNRINTVFERDIAVRLILVADNDQVVYFVPGIDPFSNGNAGTMLGESQQNLNDVIGFDNYDIGHVFTTAGAGLAQLESVCGNGKARGVTGVQPPIGDFYSIDYASHEIGHQFGANHTFNNCGGNENPSTGFEPGSGATIMAYAGLCGSNNLQFNSDDYFHGISVQEMTSFIDNGGINCATTIPSGNTPPSLNIMNGGFHIPISTPFELTADASDVDGDMLTYCWEQFDGSFIQYPLGSPAGTAPLFRSFQPDASPTRVFPKIEKIVNNNYFSQDEYLPNYARELNFNVTIRDNNAGAGGIAFDALTFDVTDAAGPFEVMTPNTNIDWEVGDYTAVQWDVANTDASPVNCQLVNIALSIDGGFTYPIVLAENVPNNGEAFIVVPDNLTNNARIRVQAADNIFFDISNTNFSIVPPSQPGFSYVLTPNQQDICLPNNAVIEVVTASLLGFNDSIQLSITTPLPTGATASFNNNPALPADGSQLTLNLSNVNTNGTFPVTIEALVPGVDTSYRTVNVRMISNDYSDFALESPVDGLNGASELPMFSWLGSDAAQNYFIEVATSPTFESNTIFSSGTTPDTFYAPLSQLAIDETYYWRVRPSNECGEGVFTNIRSFHTISLNCNSYEDNTTNNISSSGTPTVENKINISTGGEISDLNVAKIKGAHDAILHLDFTLVSPSGTELLLLSGPCGNTSTFDFGLDDESPLPFGCPPIGGGIFKSPVNLSTFNGENPMGEWTLRTTVNNTAGNGGAVQRFHLQICSSVSTNPPFLVRNDTMPLPSSQARQITDEFLLVEDDNNESFELEYTVVKAPQHGQLFFLGNEVNVGDNFRQSSLDGGNVVYIHNGDPELFDDFTFTVTDNEGGFIGTPQFNIKIDENVMINVDDIFVNNDVNIFPNPNDGNFTIIFQQSISERINIQLTNLQGQLVFEKNMDNISHQMNIQTNGLPTGIYFLQMKTEGSQMVKKIIVK